MSKLYKIVLLITMAVLPLQANSGLTSAFEFLKIDYSPRTSATAGALLSVRNDPNALFTNPAGLAYVSEKQTAFNYTKYLLDISGGTLLYVHPLKNIGVLSAGLVFMDYGTWDEVNELVEKTGQQFSANDFAMALSFSGWLDSAFSYGVNLKYAYSKIHDYSANALAMDFGLLWAMPFQEDLFMAVTMRNLEINSASYGGGDEDLPFNINLAVTKKLQHLPLEIALSVNDLNVEAKEISDYFKRFSLGGEFRLSEKLRLRLGYNNDLNQGLRTSEDQKFGGINAGLGFIIKSFRIDYAYTNFSSLGSVHRFGVMANMEAFGL